MPKIHPDATLTPHFREFLPEWIARQPWYPGSGAPAVQMLGQFRFEDPAGEVGIETHLVTDGTSAFQLPMTYRDGPLAGGSLIATAEHSVLGKRWIYDAETDPVWTAELLRVVRASGDADPSVRAVAPSAVARGRRVRDFVDERVRIDLHRVLTPGEPPTGPDVVGTFSGNWELGEPRCFAVVREVS